MRTLRENLVSAPSLLYFQQRKKADNLLSYLPSLHLAEAGGFEPPVRLPVRQFSKLVVSATHPNFLSALISQMQCKITTFFEYAKWLRYFFCKIV